jgi:predicted TIM-barrel enzyme
MGARLRQKIVVRLEAFQQPVFFGVMGTCVQNQLHERLLTLTDTGFPIAFPATCVKLQKIDISPLARPAAIS